MRSQQRLAALLLLAVGNAWATDTTTTFLVTATVSSSCAVSAGNVAFGTYNPGSLVNTDALATISVTCTLLTPYTLKLNEGANAATAGDTSSRRMKANTADYLPYQLYSDALRTSPWDNSTGVSGTGTGLAAPHSVYGRISAGNNVPSGSYQDTITVTLSY